MPLRWGYTRLQILILGWRWIVINPRHRGTRRQPPHLRRHLRRFLHAYASAGDSRGAEAQADGHAGRARVSDGRRVPSSPSPGQSPGPSGPDHASRKSLVALATGSLPAEGESVYKLLQSASQQGHDLNSAFAAAMGQTDAVRTGAYQEAGRTNDEAFLFARTAVNRPVDMPRAPASRPSDRSCCI